MDVFIIDFESYFDKDYGLNKMMMCEYILDSRFDAYMLGVRKLGSDKTHILPRDHIQRFFDALNPETTTMVAHNAFFDGFVAEHRFGFQPARWICTTALSRLVTGRALHSHSLANMSEFLGVGVKGKELANAKGVPDPLADPALYQSLAGYCRTDVNLTHDALNIMLSDPQVTDTALDIIDWTIKSYCRPTIKIDPHAALAMLKAEKATKQAVIEASGLTKKDLGSAPKIKAYLKSLGVAIPMKQGKNGPIPALAKTDKGMQELVEHEDPRVRAVAAARLGVKSTQLETRLARFVKLGTLIGGYLAPTCLLAYGAQTTGRFSGSDKTNVQNLTKGKGGIRSLFQAPAGYMVMAVDSSNIEPRVSDTLAQDEESLQVYRSGGDIYLKLASDFYGEEVTAEDKDRRTFAKIMKLSLNYGSGHVKFKETCKNWAGMDITEADSKEAVNGYRRISTNITDMWSRCDYALEMIASKSVPAEGYPLDPAGIITVVQDGLLLPNGFKIKYPNLRKEQVGDDDRPQFRYGKESYENDKGKWVYGTKIYAAMVFENICQAVAGAIISEQLLKINEVLPVAFMVHDEVVMIVPVDRADEFLDYCVQVMSTPPAWMPHIPLAAEGSYANDYSLCK